MSIRRGSEYGERRPLPDDGPIASTDSELASIVSDLRTAERAPIVVGLLGGDLCRTVGGLGSSDRLHGPEARTLPIDLGIATIDGVEHAFVAHVICGALFGPNFVAVMNAQWWESYDLGPRSHPGDGLVDITQGSLHLRQRRLARRRARTGSHLPHPDLSVARVSEATIEFDSSVEVLIDGTTRCATRSITVTVVPDAFSIVI